MASEPPSANRNWFTENTKWVLVTVAIPLTTYLFGLYQERVAKVEASAQQEIADKNRALEATMADARNNVSAMTALLPALSDPDPNRSSLALIVLKQLEKAQHSNDTRLTDLSSAVQARIDQLSHSDSAEQRERGARQQEALSRATGAAPVLNAQPAIAPPVAAVQQVEEAKPRIVYLQVYDDAQRAQAVVVQQMLREAGVGAPGIDNVGPKIGARAGVHSAQIRYFNAGDLGRAKWLQRRLAETGSGDWTILRASAAGVPAGQIELWWPHKAGQGAAQGT